MKDSQDRPAVANYTNLKVQWGRDVILVRTYCFTGEGMISAWEPCISNALGQGSSTGIPRVIFNFLFFLFDPPMFSDQKKTINKNKLLKHQQISSK
jgi:hypothetical protein